MLVEVEELSGKGFKKAAAFGEVKEGGFPVFEALVFEFGVVGEGPLSASVFVGPVVSFAREVEPFGVAEFVADESEPGFAAGNHGEEAEEFVEGEAPVDDGVLVAFFHVPVHVLVHEPEGEGFIADECLVMGFGVGDGLFLVASVGELVPDGVEVPLFVGSVFEEFDPVVGDAHAEAVVEAETAVFGRAAESGHAGEVFGDGESIGVDFADEGVGELEVGHGAPFDAVVEVFVVVVEGGIAVVVVEHGGDTIEAEAVEVKLFEPVCEVGEEEGEGFGTTVVEEEGVPLGVFLFAEEVSG